MNEALQIVRTASKVGALPPVRSNKARNRNRRSRRGVRRSRNAQSRQLALQGQTGTSMGPVKMSADVTARDFPELTFPGEMFLKCAVADPDFSQTGFQGIPDGSTVRSLKRKHILSSTAALTAGQDTFIVVAPVPGVAFFSATTAAGAPPVFNTVYNGVAYADGPALFPGGAGGSVVDRFRIASLGIKLKANVNEMTWTGSMRVWKAPLRLVMRNQGAYVATVTGMQSVIGTQANQYMNSVKFGSSTYAFKDGDTFGWSDTTNSITALPATPVAVTDGGQLVAPAGMDIAGIGETEAIFIKISGVTVNETVDFIVWQCSEYQVVVNSTLYPDTTASPFKDALALDYYNRLARSLPIAVAYDENDGLWLRVLEILHGVSGALSVLPGSYGSVARGVNLVTGGLRRLAM